MKNIVYVSTAVKPMTEDELIEILNISRDYNSQFQISGVLLYAQGTFIQAIEGANAEIDKLYANIVNDQRHKNTIKLIDGPITERSFAEWAMGFCSIATDKAAALLGYLQLPGNWTDSSSSAAVTTVKSFIDSNQLNVIY